MVVKIERVRYLKVDFYGKVPEISQFVSHIRNKIRLLGGELQLAESGVHVVEYQEGFAIIKCIHLYRDLVEAAIQLLSFDNLMIIVRKVSGTLKSLSATAVDNDTIDNEQ